MIDDSMQVVRIGQNKDISSPIASKYTMEAYRNNVFEKIEEKAKKYCEEQELVYSQIESKGEKDKWERIKTIQKDWIKDITDITKSQKQIGYNYNKNINYIERDSGFYISWNFENQYRVYGIPHYKKVISEGMNFANVEYYMEKIVN